MSQAEIGNGPTPCSYWVVSGRLAAGEYPGAKNPTDAATKLRTLIDAGIDHFIDLTEPDELVPYDEIAGKEAELLGLKVVHERHPIPDVSVPLSPERMANILDAIDDAISSGKSVYVHCWGGVGRTGTVVGCWLVRKGNTGDQALEQIATWWKGLLMEKIARQPSSPETNEQCDYVRSWTEPSTRKN